MNDPLQSLLAHVLDGSVKAHADKFAITELNLIDSLLSAVGDPALIQRLTATKAEICRIYEAMNTADEPGQFFLYSDLMSESHEVQRISVEFVAAGLERIKNEFPNWPGAGN